MTTYVDERLIFDDDVYVERIQERRYKVGLATSVTLTFTDGDCVQFTNDETLDLAEGGYYTNICSVWGA